MYFQSFIRAAFGLGNVWTPFVVIPHKIFPEKQR
jgi:hypothetical protein